MDRKRLNDAFARMQSGYERLWCGPEATELDIGNHPELDEIHAAAVESDEFRTLLTSGRRLVVVDLGAGRGSRMSRHLAVAHPLLVAVDCFPSFARLPLACPGAKVLSDAVRCGLRASVADLVVSAYLTLNNPLFHSPDTRAAYVDEILRLLRPGGVFWGEEPGLEPSDFARRPEILDYGHLSRWTIHTFQKAH